VSRTLIVVGIVLVMTGICWPLIGRLGLGRLPGDVVIQRSNFSLYFSLMTSLIISIVLSVVLWLINRWIRWQETEPAHVLAAGSNVLFCPSRHFAVAPRAVGLGAKRTSNGRRVRRHGRK
jgi:hypothetical protein